MYNLLGKVKIIASESLSEYKEGAILVTWLLWHHQ